MLYTHRNRIIYKADDTPIARIDPKATLEDIAVLTAADSMRCMLERHYEDPKVVNLLNDIKIHSHVCPICGGELVTECTQDDKGTNSWTIGCLGDVNCPLNIRGQTYLSEDDALKWLSWQRERKAQDLLQYYVTHYEYGEDPDIYKDAVEIIAPQTRKDLKPCPFCGGEARVETVYEGYSYAVECTNCMVRMEGADTEAQAIACWNRRI